MERERGSRLPRILQVRESEFRLWSLKRRKPPTMRLLKQTCKYFLLPMEETVEEDIKLSEVQMEGDEQPSTNGWKGVFSVSSYTQYFNVDTDVVLERIVTSLNPLGGTFFSKIDANPDLYGLVWISTTLVFVIALLGNCATYLIRKQHDSSTSWSFDVNYVNLAACGVYGYVFLVPLAFYFLLQYLGSRPSLVHLWCMWGYSLFIFIFSSILLVIPVEVLRWIIIILTGLASACFVSLNMKSYIEAADLMVVVVAAFALQVALAFFIKICFFP